MCDGVWCAEPRTVSDGMECVELKAIFCSARASKLVLLMSVCSAVQQAKMVQLFIVLPQCVGHV